MNFRYNPLPIGLILLCLAALTPTSTLKAQTQWYKVTSPDKEFTVEFPREPEYTFRSNPATGYGTGVFRMVYGRYAFETSYQQIVLPLKTNEDVIQFLNTTKDWQRQSWAKMNIKRTRLVDLTGGGYEADGYGHFDNGRPEYIRVRTYFRDGRLYVVTCTSGSPSGLGGEIVDRYLDSFRFLDVRLKKNRDE